jgi:hypothetical protein
MDIDLYNQECAVEENDPSQIIAVRQQAEHFSGQWIGELRSEAVEAAGDLAGFGNVRVSALIRSSLVPSQIFALTRFE